MEVWAMTLAAFSRFRNLQVAQSGPPPEAAQEPKQSRQKSIAVLSLHGVLENRLSLRGYLFGGTSMLNFGKVFQAAVDDPSVGGILIDIDSPGGSVFGTHELSERIYAARGAKPIIAIANSVADSAAYWVGTSADRLYVTPSGRAGSVGTMVTHEDWSKAYEQAGVKEHLIVSADSPNKGEWLNSREASPEYLADLQKMVDEYQAMFTSSVARNRGVTPAEVRSKFGKGRDVGAKEAVERGMADGVATFDDVLSKMVEGRMKIRRASAIRELRIAALTADL